MDIDKIAPLTSNDLKTMIDTIDLSSTYGSDTISITSPAPGPMLTSGTFNTNTVWTTDNTWTSPSMIGRGGQLSINGENADIVINGKSLSKTIQDIEDRLCILRPNQELEEQWDQLKELGEQYRKLEAEFKEKSKMWDTLKK